MHIYRNTTKMTASTTTASTSTSPTFPSTQKGISKKSICLECLRIERWNADFAKGNVYCPGAPRVHTCRKQNKSHHKQKNTLPQVSSA